MRLPSIRLRPALIVAALLTTAACRQPAPAGSASTPVFKTVDVANVVRDPADVPRPLGGRSPTTVTVTLTVREVVSELSDSVTYGFWTFDGTVPGQMLRVMEGDRVQLTLVNPKESKFPHNIDLHAVNGPGGGAAVTAVLPGETKTFTFKALNPGAYIYHCAYSPPYYHISQGMYGVIVVEPRGGLSRVDREFYVVQGEWYTAGANGAKGHQEFSLDKAMAEQPEYFTFNGHTAALTKVHPLKADVGERVRIFFGDGGPNIGANFHVIGEVFDRAYSGSPATYTANEETWYTPPGSASIFEFVLNVPGNYLLVDHALWRVAKGAAGVLAVEGKPDTMIYSPTPAGSGGH